MKLQYGTHEMRSACRITETRIQTYTQNIAICEHSLPRSIAVSYSAGNVRITEDLGEEAFKYLGTTLTNQNSIQEEIKSRLKLRNACYHSVQKLLSSSLLSKNLKIKI